MPESVRRTSSAAMATSYEGRPAAREADGMTVLLAIGTRKGLFLGTSEDRASWEVSGPLFPMEEVSAIGIDTRDGRCRLLAGTMSWHWGPVVVHSDDLGASWSEPEQGSLRFPESTGAALARVWQLRPAP